MNPLFIPAGIALIAIGLFTSKKDSDNIEALNASNVPEIEEPENEQDDQVNPNGSDNGDGV